MPDEEQVKEKLGSNYLHLEDIRQFIEKEIGETT
jgi:hypothetical protein